MRGPIVAGLAAAVVLGACGSDAGSEPSALDAVVAEAAPAVAPFEGLTESEVIVGDERLRVVIADDAGERGAGLRDRTELVPYDGMLFVHETDSTGSFTMRGVAEPLDLAFYDADGERVGSHEMEPCPERSDCPSYPPPEAWRYALETRPGELPGGPLRPAG